MEKTVGQVAYEAFWDHRGLMQPRWASLHERDQASWESAAHAVISNPLPVSKPLATTQTAEANETKNNVIP